MIETLLALDQRLFAIINGLPHNDFFDGFAMLITGVGAGWFLWYVLRKHKVFFPLMITAGVSWIFSEFIIKPFFARQRPSVYAGFSFPSSHAMVAFTLATVLSGFEPRWKRSLYFLATIIGISRIYLGVHYPSDVIIGAGLGWIIGIEARRLMQVKSYRHRKK